ncbi:membrane protein [Acidovorax sp. KKS102]|uniref:acyltransferase family protein n=1 Tax=Acidovorax sp. KKS102 TaxID=358220 RepID=UPI00028AB39F|nr:acyltransferase [Acidovorax sp. KKS102]AFU44358.1 membrane protein [Acidovorax sp. KKS102]
MGTLRYLLAVLVLLSHAGVNVSGHHPGVMAVAVFYAISGYVMSGLIQQHYSQPASVPRFYLDRSLRIYPQYAFYALATAIWFWLTRQPTAFLQHPPSLQDVLNNLLIVPLNYYMINGADQFTLIPPAWSLGAELLFYLLAPWLWRNWAVSLCLLLLSLGVQVLAWHGVLHSDWWGYRLLPGVLWIFLLGMAMHRFHAQGRPKWAGGLALATPALGVVALWYLQAQGLLVRHYTLEVVLGVCFAIPALQAVRGPLLNSWWKKFDSHLGDISYGVFLNHFFLMWFLAWAAPLTAVQLLSLVALSTLLSLFTFHYIEKPVLHWRRRLRQS